MKIATLLLAIALIFVFVGAQKLLFQKRYEIDLTTEALQLCANSSDYDNVTVSFQALDATLTGTVPSPEARLKIAAQITNLKGARLPETNNQLIVPLKLDASRSGSNLTLSGYLPDKETQSRIISFIKARRPDFNIDSAGLIINRFVDTPEFPEQENFPGYLESVWSALREPAFVNIIKTGPAFALEGLLPSEEWKEILMEAITTTAPDITINDSELIIGDHAKDPGFLKKAQLMNFLRGCFVIPATNSIRLTNESASYGGKATLAQSKFIDQFASDLGYESEQLHSSFEIFPTPQHIPEYAPRSNLDPDTLKELRSSLAKAPIDFEMGSAQVPDEQLGKLNTAANTIAGVPTDTDLKLVVGGYAFPAGDPAARDLARDRAESIISLLVERKVPREILEVVDFGPGPSGEDTPNKLTNRAEILVK